jgi:hypothetical protein
MKRLGVCALAAAAAALLVAAAATAGTSAYKGAFDPSGKLRFEVTRHAGKRVIAANSFAFRDLPLTCAHGSETTSGHLNVDIKIKHGRFHKRLFAQGRTVDATLRVHGRFHRHRRRAVGTMRVSGPAVPVDNGSPARCDTGVLGWKARRR